MELSAIYLLTVTPGILNLLLNNFPECALRYIVHLLLSENIFLYVFLLIFCSISLEIEKKATWKRSHYWTFKFTFNIR